MSNTNFSGIAIDVQFILRKELRDNERQSLFYQWYALADEVLMNDEFQKRIYMEHHRDTSVFEHCVMVSFLVYLKALKKRCNDDEILNAVVAGLLHDFYTHAWRCTESSIKLGSPYCDHIHPANVDFDFYEKHCFTHPKEALQNAAIHFPYLMNDRVEDAILRHMFPLTKPLFRYPKYIEGVLLTWIDKKSSAREISNFKEIMKLA